MTATSRRGFKQASEVVLDKYQSSLAYQFQMVKSTIQDNLVSDASNIRYPLPSVDSIDSVESSGHTDGLTGARSTTNAASKVQMDRKYSRGDKESTVAPSRKQSLPAQAPFIRGKQMATHAAKQPVETKTQARGAINRQQQQQQQQQQKQQQNLDLEDDARDHVKDEYVANWLANVDEQAFITCQSPAIFALYSDPEMISTQTDTAIHIVYNG